MHITTSISASILLLASTVLADGYYIKAYTRALPKTGYHHEGGYFLKSSHSDAGPQKTAINLIDSRIGADWEDAKWAITNEITDEDSGVYHLAEYASHKVSINSNVWRGLSVEDGDADDARVAGTLGTYSDRKDWVKVQVLETKERTTVFELFADAGLWLCTQKGDTTMHRLTSRDISQEQRFRDIAVCQSAILYAYDADWFEKEFKYVQNTWAVLGQKKNDIPLVNNVRFPPTQEGQGVGKAK